MTKNICNPFAATLLISVIFASPAMAESAAQNPNARFSIIETAKGFLRLDQKNGNISICKIEGGQMGCKMAADERHAYQKEIERVNQQLDKIKARLGALEGRETTAKLKSDKPDTKEEEFDRALKFADKAFRQFFGMVQELKKEKRKDAI